MQKPTGETLHILAIDLVTDIAGQVLRDFIVGFAAITGAQEVVAVIHKDDTTAIDLHLSAGQIAVPRKGATAPPRPPAQEMAKR